MARYLEIAAKGKRGLNWDAVRDVPVDGCMVYDLTNLPMEGVSDNSYDGIYSEHFIEHLYKYQGINFFIEALRILKPGGTIRTVWPPYEFVEKLVSGEKLSNEEEAFVEHYYNFYILKEQFAPPKNKHRSKREQCALGLLYQKGEHLYVWSKIEMIMTLKSLGFVSVKEKPYMQSSVMDFNNIDTPGHIRALHSAVVEAEKPW